MFRRRLPSPALTIAVLALFVALGGSAVAATVVQWPILFCEVL